LTAIVELQMSNRQLPANSGYLIELHFNLLQFLTKLTAKRSRGNAFCLRVLFSLFLNDSY